MVVQLNGWIFDTKNILYISPIKTIEGDTDEGEAYFQITFIDDSIVNIRSLEIGKYYQKYVLKSEEIVVVPGNLVSSILTLLYNNLHEAYILLGKVYAGHANTILTASELPKINMFE